MVPWPMRMDFMRNAKYPAKPTSLGQQAPWNLKNCAQNSNERRKSAYNQLQNASRPTKPSRPGRNQARLQSSLAENDVKAV